MSKAATTTKAKPAAKAKAPDKKTNGIDRSAPSLTPHIVCRGAAKAIDFYKKAFGAVELMRLPAPDGRLMHAAVQINGAMVMLNDEMPEAVNDAVDNTKVKAFPQALSRKPRDRIDDIAVVYFVDPPFFLKDLRHFPERRPIEQSNADPDSAQSKQYGKTREETFRSQLFCGMSFRHVLRRFSSCRFFCVSSFWLSRCVD